MNSIRRHLLILLLATLTLGVLVASAAVYVLARQEANDLFDYHLEQVARSLPGRSFSAIDPEVQSIEQNDDGSVVIQIWDRAGVQLYFSRPSSRLPERAELGFSTVQTPNGAWRVYSSLVGANVVQVAQPMQARRQLAQDIAFRTVTPLLLLLPVLGVAILLIVGRGLRPLRRIAAEVDARSASALDPVKETSVPEEVQPLVQALNSLLGRLDRALAAQRAFLADAAHELRTPLTAIKLQTDLLARAQNEEERTEALHKLEAGVERGSHLVQQLLTLARQEPAAAQRLFTRIDLAELARTVIAERTALALERQIDLGLARAEAGVVAGDLEALQALVGNLVDNALRYTPPGGKVDVEVYADAGVPMLVVSDTGPGIAPQERERVFDRFYRVPGTGAPGTGLGLAIVKSIAEIHGARIELLEAPGGGLRVAAAFPGPADAVAETSAYK
ncbi:MAG TPA: ATP-binding protein [Burkholderiales bacterium]|jgi:two-component system OmpR family sensor kinase|nr:ATP-binding protein [Burkholderiales bacterium]